VDITDEFFAFCGLFGELPLLQFFADMHPTLNMRTGERGLTSNGRRFPRCRSLDILEYFFDIFGQVIELGGLGKDLRESTHN